MKYPFVLIIIAVLSTVVKAEDLIRPEIEGPHPWTNKALLNDPEEFQFVIVTDRTGGMRPGVFKSAVEKVNLLRPEFVISIGDLIEGYTENKETLDRQWTEFASMAESFDMPFFFVSGNHDYSNEVMYQEWKERFGPSYYHFLYQDVLFLCVNTQDPHPLGISDEQINYFKQVLNENKNVRWTLVFIHQPLWLYEEDNTFPKFEQLLQGRDYTVFAGHYHQYTKYERFGKKYIVLATTGGGSDLQGDLHGEFDHVVWATMTDGGPVLANLMLSGVRDENIRTEEITRLLNNHPIEVESVFSEDEIFSGKTIEIQLQNVSESSMSLEAEFAEQDYIRPIPKKFDRLMAPGAKETVTVRLDIRQAQPVIKLGALPLMWSATFNLSDRPAIKRQGTEKIFFETLYQVSRVDAAPKIDGKLKDWPKLPYEVKSPAEIRIDPENWTGPKDSWYRFGLGYDEDYLYVAVEVFDEELIFLPGEMPWTQDGVEIRIDARPAPERNNNRGWGENTTHLLLATSPAATAADDRVVYQKEKLPVGLEFITVQTGQGHITEAAIPISYLNERQGEDWEAFRFSIAVNDYDEGKQGSQQWWRPDWRSHLTFPGSGTFVRE